MVGSEQCAILISPFSIEAGANLGLIEVASNAILWPTLRGLYHRGKGRNQVSAKHFGQGPPGVIQLTMQRAFVTISGSLGTVSPG